MISAVLFTQPIQGHVHIIRVKRTRPDENEELFDFPGGPRIEDHSYEELAVQYIQQQTGIAVQPDSLSMPWKCDFPCVPDETLFICELTAGNLETLRDPKYLVSLPYAAVTSLIKPQQFGKNFRAILDYAMVIRKGTLGQS